MDIGLCIIHNLRHPLGVLEHTPHREKGGEPTVLLFPKAELALTKRQ